MLVPVLTVFATSLANLVFVGPATTKIMLERRRQGECVGDCPGYLLSRAPETKDGKKSFDPPPHSEDMQKLNKAFGSMHGISSLLNMAALIATVWYGVSLAERLH